MSCLFCNIVSGTIPAKIAYQDDIILAFEDINPQAPTHLLIIPKKHISTINELEAEDSLLIGQMVQTAKKLAKDYHIADAGYRLVMNCNANGGQAVFHIHLHLLGGRPLTWPPG